MDDHQNQNAPVVVIKVPKLDAEKSGDSAEEDESLARKIESKSFDRKD